MTTLGTDTVGQYRRFGHEGMRAVHAYRCASAPPPVVRYRSGPGDAITILLDSRPDAAGFTVTATPQPHPAPDIHQRTRGIRAVRRMPRLPR